MPHDHVFVVHKAFQVSQTYRSFESVIDAEHREWFGRKTIEDLYYAAFHSVRSVLVSKFLVRADIPHKLLWDWIATADAKAKFPDIGKTHTRAVRLQEWREMARYDIGKQFDKDICAAESDVRSILKIVDKELCDSLEMYRPKLPLPASTDS